MVVRKFPVVQMFPKTKGEDAWYKGGGLFDPIVQDFYFLFFA